MTASLLRRLLALFVLFATAFAVHAAPVELAGVKIADPIDLRGSALKLNGAGIRYKAVFKVYTAALYLSQKASTPEEVLAAPGAKRMSITMLRDIDSNELGNLFLRGVEDNIGKNKMAPLMMGLVRMGQMFSDQKQLKAGDVFTIDWLPGTGTVITVKGTAQPDPIKQEAFFDALMRIWLGPKPADYKLKDALLGKE